MGDVSYPGVLINSANPAVSEYDVIRYFTELLEPSYIRFGGPRVKIYSRVGGTTRVVVTGIHMCLDNLRFECTKMIQLKNRIVKITNVDFGVTRKSDGEMDFQLLSLHNHLREGQGMREPINLLTKPIKDAFGNFGELESTIYFDDVKENVQSTMLKEHGMIYYSGNSVARGTQGQRYKSEKIAYSNMEVIMKTRVQSFQSICVLNRNEKFSGLKRSFITSNDGVFHCKLDMKCGLGMKGEILDIESLVSLNGYVPLHLLSDRIVSRAVISNLSTRCHKCGAVFQILGIGPDFSWLAAKCECKKTRVKYTWANEDFVRLIQAPSRKKIHSSVDSEIGEQIKDNLIIFARGLLPLYDSPFQFREIPFAVYCLQFEYGERLLEKHQTMGRLIKKYFVERYKLGTGKKAIKITTYALRIEVPTTKVWCEEGLKHIGKVCLISEGDTYAPTVPICHITSSGKPGFSVVTFRVKYEKDPNLAYNQIYIMVPKPPTAERDAIESTLAGWEGSFFDETKLFHFGRVLDVYVWESAQDKNSWVVRVNISGDEMLSIVSDLLKECYVGVEMKILVQKEGRIIMKTITGRVTFAKPVGTGMEFTIVVFLDKSMTVLKNVFASSQFWVIAKSRCLVGDVLEESENWDWSWKLGRLLDVFVDCTVVVGDVASLESIITVWKERPKMRLPKMNYLLHPSEKVDHETKIMDENSKMYDKKKVASLQKKLNPSQVTGVDIFLTNPLSLLQGPPGTGKTDTIAHGITKSYLVNDGLNLACCPSNYACDVLYQKVKEVNEEHQVGMKVVRMQSYTREKQMLSKTPLDEADQNQLHVMVRKHPEWNRDEKMNKIIEKSKRFGGALLKRKESKALIGHTNYITKKILQTSDVIVCTVGSASDGRIGYVVYDYKEPRKLASLVIDEASLLTVPSCLPILKLNPTRLWLVGDQCQLRPSVQNDSAVVSCLDVSWMEFLSISPFIKKGINYSMLNVQYRMAAGIASVVSKFMYNDEVKSSEQVKERNYENHPILIEFPELKACNIGCYTYDGPQEQKAEPSYYNLKEIEMTKCILLKLNLCNIPMSSVTIITMYACQSTYLTDMVSELGAGFEEVQVSTVDSSQGTESPIIILNMVRSNRKEDGTANVGFLRDQNRMNVAMSRSIDFLLLVCDVETMKMSSLPSILKLFNLLEEQQVDLDMKM